jgi:shikimate kinase
VSLLLVGFMGCGKSTVGRLAAGELGLPFVDLDARVAAAAGRSIEAIFAERGEAGFRSAEAQALVALEPELPAVVAGGGGLFTARGARRWAREHGLSLWLDVPLEELRRRLGDGKGRPLWAGTELEQRMLYERRRACYALASVRLAAGGRPAADLARGAALLYRAVFR